jgi:hypothetical protein
MTDSRLSHAEAPGRPFLGRKRAVIQFLVAATILAIFMFVTWSIGAGSG